MKESPSRSGSRFAERLGERFEDWFSELTPARLWQRVRQYRIENLGLKLLAIGLATLLFAISRQPMSDVRLVGVQLEYRGLAPGLETSGELNQTVSVRLRGPRDAVRGLLPNQIAVVANLSDKEPGERVIQLKTSDVALPDSIEVLQIDPSTIPLRIEQTTRRRVPVEPELSGKIPEGFEIYRVSVAPSEVDIEGPQSQVSQVEVVTTESVQLTGRTASFGASVDVYHPDHAIRVLTPGPLRISIEMGERRTTRLLNDLKVKWLDPTPRGRLLDPVVSLEVFGPRSTVDALRPEDIRVQLKTSGLPVDVQSATPEVVLPIIGGPQLEVRKMTPAAVRFKRENKR